MLAPVARVSAQLSSASNIIEHCARMYGSCSDEQDDREQQYDQPGAKHEHVTGHVRGGSGAGFGSRQMLFFVGHYALVTNGTLKANAPRQPMFRRVKFSSAGAFRLSGWNRRRVEEQGLGDSRLDG